MTASHPAPAHVLSRVAPSFLAADVGGTHVRVARAQAGVLDAQVTLSAELARAYVGLRARQALLGLLLEMVL